MKIFILIFSIIIVLLIAGYFFIAINLGAVSFPVGFKNGHLIMYGQTCVDISCHWSRYFFGKIDEQTCINIGGKPDYVTAAGVVDHGYNGCSPE